MELKIDTSFKSYSSLKKYFAFFMMTSRAERKGSEGGGWATSMH
jgi:hypothetical protein